MIHFLEGANKKQQKMPPLAEDIKRSAWLIRPQRFFVHLFVLDIIGDGDIYMYFFERELTPSVL